MRLWSTVAIQLQIPVSLLGLGMMRGNSSEIGLPGMPGCVVAIVDELRKRGSVSLGVAQS